MARRTDSPPDAGGDPVPAGSVARMAVRVDSAGGTGVRPVRRSPRTNTYSREVAEEILQLMADGMSTPKISEKLGIPDRSIYQWIIDDHDGFGQRYARAKHIVALRWADELTEIADHKKDDYTLDEDGNMVPDHEHIARSRLRIDTRKWILGKVLPKVYGDKVVAEITGKDGGAIEMQATKIDVLALAPEQRDQLKQILLQATKGRNEDE